MRFIVLSFFLLSLFLCFSSLSVNGQYAGVFLDTRSKQVAASMKNTTSPYNKLNEVDLSYKRTQAHHLTIEFKPIPANKFQQFYQDKHDLKVLAYAHDAHGQALLVDLKGNKCKTQGGIEIANEWPHITISDQMQAPYTAVYSNDLIGRLFSSEILKVKAVDSYGKPTNVGFGKATKDTRTDEMEDDEWWGTAPVFTSKPTATTNSTTYDATPVYVRLFPHRERFALKLTGTVCWNQAWNDTTTKCQAQKPTTQKPQ